MSTPSLTDTIAELTRGAVTVETAEFDPLRDEGLAYAQALQDAGTDANGVCYEGLVHDFFATAAMFQCSRAGFLPTIDALKANLN